MERYDICIFEILFSLRKIYFISGLHDTEKTQKNNKNRKMEQNRIVVCRRGYQPAATQFPV